MIDYKLAKELKDAGFPQEGTLKAMGIHNDGALKFHPEPCEMPQLSELIEACGDRFLIRLEETFAEGGGTHWWAKARWKDHDTWIEAINGSTPEIAVAKLWLELNKKK